MEKKEEKIKRLLDTFYKVTQMEVVFFDRDLNAVSCQFNRHVYEDLLELSAGKIEGFLHGFFEKDTASHQNFYTFFLNNNLVCNILTLCGSTGVYGAFVTQPALLSALKSSEIDTILDGLSLDSEKRDRYKQALQRAPVISYDRIMPLGQTLSSLSRSVFDEMEFHQILCGGDLDPALYQMILPTLPANRTHKSVMVDRHGGYLMYRKLKDSVSKGDATALLKAISGISAGSVPMDHLSSKSYVRSLKNSFIEVCAMCRFFAIDAGAPYLKTADLTEEYIDQMENTENINDIYELMKSALLAFTRLVAVTRITGYSKPVKLSMEYIETHYKEKITLGVLAQRVNLSKSYLSNLIKKQTGLDMADNINKVRIAESKKILLRSRVSVSELSSMVGYSYSNHFARIFKQFTGMTPSEFKKSTAGEWEEERETQELIHQILEQFAHTLTMYPGMIDVIRIVDPVSHLSWVRPHHGETVQGTCYEFWSRNKSCDKCISQMAFSQNKSFMKIDQKPDSSFFVLAAPVNIGQRKYVLELLKNISEDFYDCTAPARDGHLENSRLPALPR